MKSDTVAMHLLKTLHENDCFQKGFKDCEQQTKKIRNENRHKRHFENRIQKKIEQGTRMRGIIVYKDTK